MKNVLYLSSLCSVEEYKKMFSKYGTTSSHASQKFNRLFVKGLIENNCEVYAISQKIVLNEQDVKKNIELDSESNVNYEYISWCKKKPHNSIEFILKARRQIKKWIKNNPEGIVICDIVLGEMSIALLTLSYLLRGKRFAIVTDVPSIRAGEQRKGFKAIPYKIKNALIDYYDGYIFLTEQMNQILNKNHKPYVVIEGIADEEVIKYKNTVENKDRKKIVMMAGLLEEIFGVDILLESFSQIKNDDLELNFYGKGSSINVINNYSAKDPRIKYCGELTNEEIVKKETQATLLVNPRPPIGEWTSYSFPSKNMEYMASGTPLIAFDLPCIPKEYKQYFFCVKDVDDFKVLLKQIITKNTEVLNTFGLEAQKWIIKNKSSRVQVKKFVNMVSKI